MRQHERDNRTNAHSACKVVYNPSSFARAFECVNLLEFWSKEMRLSSQCLTVHACSGSVGGRPLSDYSGVSHL